MNRSEHSHFNPWLALVVVCLGQFMVVLDATIVNVALPAIKSDLHISAANLQWIVNAYTLLFGGFLLLGGRAADLFGRRNLFLAGVTLFSTASLVNGLASSEEMLIGARAAQGLGAALMSPAALAVITTTFAEGAERTKALSIWAAIASGGSAVGLLLGGVLTETLSWEWIFFINVPIGIAIIFAALRFVPNSRVEGGSRHFDLVGAVSVTSGLLVLVYAIVKAQEWGWTSGSTLGLAALAVGLLGTFVWIESRSPFPLVRLSLFRLRSLAVGNAAFLIVVGGLFAMFFFASLYLQGILGYSALTTGFAFLPVTAGIMIGAVTAQQLVPKSGVRPVLLTGLSVAAVGLTILGLTTEVDGSYLGVLAGLFPMAVGMGATFVSLTLVATTNVDENDAGLASGIFNTSQQVGGALGLAVLSTLANDRTTSILGDIAGAPSHSQVQSALVDGYQLAFFAAAALLAVGAVILGVLLRQRDVARIDAGDAVPVPA
ncbi:MAG TPA: MFS transporter [Thermoleophilaceae bacterium]|nr:MFS transporter [Thermoleophilaceae bacterium]